MYIYIYIYIHVHTSTSTSAYACSGCPDPAQTILSSANTSWSTQKQSLRRSLPTSVDKCLRTYAGSAGRGGGGGR